MKPMSESIRTEEQPVAERDIALPPPTVSFSQDREWCVVRIGDEWKRIRFHDYDEIYEIPGLYEALFYEVLKCSSPRVIREILEDCFRGDRVAPGDLSVLDLGAGNGMVAEQLAAAGARRIVGVDIIKAAAEAARRDRADVYQDYFVLDMAELDDADRRRLQTFRFNCLTCVAALGFGDIPPEAFANAFNLIADGGWIAFNIKDDFLESRDASGFARLVRRMIDDETISVRRRKRYPHRLATSGEPLFYTAFAAVKNRPVETPRI
jgi:SAM-dependent methyltransferase